MTKKTTKADVSTISPSTEAFIMHEDSDKELTLTTNCKLLIFTQHSNLTLNHFFDTQFFGPLADACKHLRISQGLKR